MTEKISKYGDWITPDELLLRVLIDKSVAPRIRAGETATIGEYLSRFERVRVPA